VFLQLSEGFVAGLRAKILEGGGNHRDTLLLASKS
jgi:hypothetical protein